MDEALVAALGARDLPEDAVLRAAEEPALAADAVIAAIEAAAAGAPLSEEQENLLFWGLHALAAGRETRAFAPLMRLLRRSDDELDLLLGDARTMTMPRIVVGTFDGNAAMLLEVIADRNVNEFLRSSLLHALAFLTWEGRVELAETIRLVERIDDERLAEPEEYLWNAWSDVVTLLGLRDLAPRVEAAFKDGRIPPEMDDVDEFRKRLAATESDPADPERFEFDDIGYLDDVLGELGQFTIGGRALDEYDDEAHDSYLPALPDVLPGVPANNPFRNVGRNDPCPCGSGKKYKKCCLNA